MTRRPPEPTSGRTEVPDIARAALLARADAERQAQGLPAQETSGAVFEQCVAIVRHALRGRQRRAS